MNGEVVYDDEQRTNIMTMMMMIGNQYIVCSRESGGRILIFSKTQRDYDDDDNV